MSLNCSPQALQCHCPCSKVELELYHRGNSVCHTAGRNKARGRGIGRRICARCCAALLCAPQLKNSTKGFGQWVRDSVQHRKLSCLCGYGHTHTDLSCSQCPECSQELSCRASPRDAFLACRAGQHFVLTHKF